MYKTGDIVKIKNDSQIKYGLNGDFTKNEGRPFVVGYITEQNYYWVVPSFSNGNDYNQNIKARTEIWYLMMKPEHYNYELLANKAEHCYKFTKIMLERKSPR